MVSVLDPALSGPGSCPGRGHYIVFLGKTLNFTVFLSTQEYKWYWLTVWETRQNAGGNLQWTCIPPRGSSDTPIRSHAMKSLISSGYVVQLGPYVVP